jgi:hypothetical protein
MKVKEKDISTRYLDEIKKNNLELSNTFCM